uniref:Apical junction molecule ajm1 alpha/beta domain-containing protein n=1 Tax=Wuchereria bancrofti TaxID=6293 RepID=A0AAF5Q7M1_WUCBA
MKMHKDPETQFYMSKIACDGYSALGCGSVNLWINSAHTAQNYITDALIAERKESSLITLYQYDPTLCPQTPPPEAMVIRSTLPQSQCAQQLSLSLTIC